MSAQSYGDLPEVLARVAEAGGLQLAQGMAKAFGGRKVYVPAVSRLSARHAFATALRAQGVGLADAKLIAGIFGKELVDVPLGPFVGLSAAARRRREDIRARLAANEKRAAIATACGTTERTVYRVQAESDDAPPSLFDPKR